MPSRSFIVIALSVLVLGYIGLNFLVKWMYPKQLFPFPESSYQSLPGLTFVETDLGNQIAFIYLPNPSSGGPLLFYFHGNGEDIGMNEERFQWFIDQGYSVLALDYPSYGQSTGKPTASSIREATHAVWNYARDQLGADAGSTVLWGRSLGGAPATWLAAEDRFGGLVLESTFRSVFAVANLPFPLFLAEPFPTENLISEVISPVYLFHGRRDRIIPYSHSEKLAAAAGENASLVLFEEGTHNDLRFVGGKEMENALQSLKESIQTQNAESP